MGSGLSASNDLPWKEAFNTYLCLSTCSGAPRLMALERQEDEEGRRDNAGQGAVVGEDGSVRHQALRASGRPISLQNSVCSSSHKGDNKVHFRQGQL